MKWKEIHLQLFLYCQKMRQSKAEIIQAVGYQKVTNETLILKAMAVTSKSNTEERSKNPCVFLETSKIKWEELPKIPLPLHHKGIKSESTLTILSIYKLLRSKHRKHSKDFCNVFVYSITSYNTQISSKPVYAKAYPVRKAYKQITKQESKCIWK